MSSILLAALLAAPSLSAPLLVPARPLAARPAPGLGNASSPYDYDNPFVGGGCRAGEVAAQTSVPGAFCSPPCSPSLACSNNTAPYAPWVPPASRAFPVCMLQYAGEASPTGCALQCCPSCWGACSAPGMQCQPFGGVGVCVWPEPASAAAAAAEAGVRVLGALPARTVAAGRAATRDQLPLTVHVCVRVAPDAPCAAPAGITLAALPWSARHVQAAATAAAVVAPPSLTRSVDFATLALSVDFASGALSVDVVWPHGSADALSIILQAPRDVLAESEVRTRAATPSVSVRVAGCSNGRDDDGDAAADFPLDSDCSASWDEEGTAQSPPPPLRAAAAAPPGAPALSWVVTPHTGTGAGLDGAFVSALSYLPQGAGGPSVPIWADEVAAGVPDAVRYFLHDASNPSTSLAVTNLTSGTMVMLEQLTAVKTLVSSSATTAVIRNSWPGIAITVTDTYTLSPGARLTIAVSVASAYTGPNDVLLVNVPANFGGLALGRRAADGTLNLANSGLWRFDSKRVGSLYLGAANCGWNVTDIPTDAYPNFGGYFSAVQGIGDGSVSLGWSTLDARHSPDTQHNFSVNYYSDLRVARSPRMQQWHSQVLAAGDVHNFSIVLAAGPPAAVGLLDCPPGAPPPPPLPPAQRDVATLMAVFEPYFDWFHAVHGSTPTYCPTPGGAYQNAVDESFNTSSLYYVNNSTIKGVLNYDALVANKFGHTNLALYGVWSGGLRSEHMTLDGSNFEFNPVIEAFDPHMDIGADPSKLTEAIRDFKENGDVDKFFWFHRPCDDIVVPPENAVSASQSCAITDKTCFEAGTCECTVTKGTPVSGQDLRDANSTWAARQHARATAMVRLGVQGFYLDSHFCAGNMQYIRDLYLKNPRAGPGEPLWVMPEASIDQRSLISPQLPWVNINSWRPGVPEDFGLLIHAFLPMTGQYGGEIGPAPPMPKFNDFYGLRGFNAVFLMDGEAGNYGNATCKVIQDVYDTYNAQMKAYGTAMGCKQYAPPSPTCH